MNYIAGDGILGTGSEAVECYREALAALLESLEVSSPTHSLIEQARCNDAEAREEAAFLLGQSGVADDATLDCLIEIVDDGDEVADVRFEGARALGKLGDPKAVSTLKKRLTDSDPDLVSAAILALGMLDDDGSIEDIRERLVDKDRFVRESAARALGHLGATGHIGAIIDVMRNDPISVVRDAAAQSLWMIYAAAEGEGSAARRALKAIHRGGYTVTEVQDGCRRAEEMLALRAWLDPQFGLDLQEAARSSP